MATTYSLPPYLAVPATASTLSAAELQAAKYAATQRAMSGGLDSFWLPTIRTEFDAAIKAAQARERATLLNAEPARRAAAYAAGPNAPGQVWDSFLGVYVTPRDIDSDDDAWGIKLSQGLDGGFRTVGAVGSVVVPAIAVTAAVATVGIAAAGLLAGAAPVAAAASAPTAGATVAGAAVTASPLAPLALTPVAVPTLGAGAFSAASASSILGGAASAAGAVKALAGKSSAPEVRPPLQRMPETAPPAAQVAPPEDNSLEISLAVGTLLFLFFS